MYDPYLHARFRNLLSRLPDTSGKKKFAYLSQRLSSNLKHIQSLFYRLYGEREDVEQQYWLLIEDLIHAFAERPKKLKKQDLKREKKRDWYLKEKLVGMMLYVDRFAGKLGDFEEKINYLRELGINYVHLMPLLKSPEGSNDGGYAVSDYREVDKRFGSMEDLQRISKKLRKEGMLLTLDMVMNHTSNEHEWVQKALAGDPYYQDFYYFYDSREIPDQFEASMPEVFPHSAPGNFTYIEELEKWVMTVFHHYQWDLNYTNPNVFREMMKVLLFLANLGVDIVRLDAVAFTWKIPGTTSQNTEEAHVILQLMRACAEAVAPGMALIAEAIVSPQEVVRYFGEGNNWGHECEIAYNATFMALLWDALASGETSLLGMGAKGIPPKPEGCSWINYLRCHDDIGLGFEEAHMHQLGKSPYLHKKFLVDYYTGNFEGSEASGEAFAFNPKTGDARISGSLASLAGLEHALSSGEEEKIQTAIQKILMLHGIILTYGGIPMIYYGDEVGTLNDYSFLEEPDKAYDNRWMHRPKIDWKKLDKRREEGTAEKQIFEGLQRLILLRKASPEFADHNSLSIEESGNRHLFAFLRWNDQGARSLILSNFSPETQFVHIGFVERLAFHPFEMRDKISGQPARFYNDLIELAPYGQYWLTDPATFEAFQGAEEMEELKLHFHWSEKKGQPPGETDLEK